MSDYGQDEQHRYFIATAVLYGISFPAVLALCVLSFIKLGRSSLGHGFATWLRLACVCFTISCILQLCEFAAVSDLMAHKIDIGKQAHSLDRFMKQHEDAYYLYYMGWIAIWLYHVTQGLLFVAIVTFCAARSTKTGSIVWLIVARGLALVLNGLAIANLALGIKQHRDYANERWLLWSMRDTALAFDSIMVAAALLAAGFALSRLFKSMHIDGRPAKLAALASILFLLSALYRLSVNVKYNRFDRVVGGPNYLSILDIMLDVWAVLGGAALVFVAGKSCTEGGSMLQQKGSVA
ncbi:hypothetical protein LLEC1_05137 [Akanthomyces lecanii]|uniref:Uncharacterized protein n=1 Tax=Cordyceps confragosa TaxID=2714763 RepID=A0A179IB04_CORDF|nr:hypothetical protein LLEC1_05137 [Akanthomyces lecanii]